MLFLILAAIMTASYFEPVSEPIPSDPPSPEPHLLPGMTSTDLYRIRGEQSASILPPAAPEQAASLLAECETLWNELRTFKDDPEFRKSKFAPGSRFADWRERATYLYDNRPDKKTVGSDISRLPGALLGVACDYAGTLDHPSSQEEWFVNYFLPTSREAVRPQQ